MGTKRQSVAAAAIYVMGAKVPGHAVRARQDLTGLTGNWKAHCECGWWSASRNNEIEAWAVAERHLRSNQRK